MIASLPMAASASFSASVEPSASPSGFSCVTSRNRSCARIAAATASASLVVWGELIDQLRHADPALDGRIVFERQLRRPLQPQLPPETRLQDTVCRFESGEALPPLVLRAEDADVDDGMAEIRRCLDAGDGHEADP